MFSLCAPCGNRCRFSENATLIRKSTHHRESSNVQTIQSTKVATAKVAWNHRLLQTLLENRLVITMPQFACCTQKSELENLGNTMFGIEKSLCRWSLRLLALQIPLDQAKAHRTKAREHGPIALTPGVVTRTPICRSLQTPRPEIPKDSQKGVCKLKFKASPRKHTKKWGII